MNFFLQVTTFLILSVMTSISSVEAFDNVLNDEKLKLSKTDHIIAEHLVNMLKFTEQGYINQEVLQKVLVEAQKSKHFKPFTWWLQEVHVVAKLNSTNGLIEHCRA